MAICGPRVLYGGAGPLFTSNWPCLCLGVEDYVFGVIYLVEICIKIAGLRCEFFKAHRNRMKSRTSQGI